MNQPPKGLNLRQRIQWHMARDATCIRDAEAFRARFGEYPANFRPRANKSSKPSK